jgi:hypothetical protein
MAALMQGRREVRRQASKEEEYVTFVRILTLMCRSASIFTAYAVIFVMLYRGARLNHQGVIRCDSVHPNENPTASQRVCAA